MSAQSADEPTRAQMDYSAHAAQTSSLIAKLAATSPRVLARMHRAALLGELAGQLAE